MMEMSASVQTCRWLLLPPQVKEELLVEALTKRKAVTVNDKLILPYSHSEVGYKGIPPCFLLQQTFAVNV